MARILVIDDEPLIAMAVSDWLADLGHEVVGPAVDLAGALALVEQPIEAAILDVTLGKDDSSPVAQRLIDKKIPFVVASGHEVQSSQAAVCIGAGAAQTFWVREFSTGRRAIAGTAPWDRGRLARSFVTARGGRDAHRR